MPKIIEDAKYKILETARTQLLTEGYNKLSLRSIAKECEIAVGTIYNYFASKDILIASVMVEDWLKYLDRMKDNSEKAADLIEGFSTIYNAITCFSDIYRNVWSEYSVLGNAKFNFSDRHKLLRSQITEIIKDLLNRFGKNESEAMTIFLAESLLTVALQDDMDFEILSVVLNKIFI
jgi:AcrR family transcriptional regulator